MEKIFLCSHGSLADGLLRAVETIIGLDSNVKAYSLEQYGAPSVIAEEISREISETTDCVILCDIKGGSVHNALMPLCRRSGVYLMTGMNLTMAIDLISAPKDIALNTRCSQALESGIRDLLLFDQELINRMLESNEPDEL